MPHDPNDRDTPVAPNAREEPPRPGAPVRRVAWAGRDVRGEPAAPRDPRVPDVRDAPAAPDIAAVLDALDSSETAVGQAVQDIPLFVLFGWRGNIVIER